MSCEVITSSRIEIVKGDTVLLRFGILKADCVTPEDLELFTFIRFTIKRSTQDPDSAAIFNGTLTDGDIDIIGPTTDGIVEVTVPPECTVLMRSGKEYYWALSIATDTENRYTPRAGTIFTTFQVPQAI